MGCGRLATQEWLTLGHLAARPPEVLNFPPVWMGYKPFGSLLA